VEWAPLPYQEKALAFIIERGAAGLFLNPGRGKTSIMLAAHDLLREHRQVRRTLVICPINPMRTVWPAEVRKWDQFKRYIVTVLHGPHKDVVDLHDPRSSIHVINFDGLKWLANRIAREQEFPYDMLIVDESSYLRNTQTQRFKLLKPLLQLFRRRYILTGSPAPNSLLDLFGQFYVMDRGATFGPYITRFREEYFYPSGFGGYDWQLQKDGEERIRAAIAPRVYTMTEEDQEGLPPITYNVIRYEMSAEMKAAYNDLLRNMRLDFADGSEISAANSGIIVQKLQQFTSGAVYKTDDEEGDYIELHDERIEVLKEIIEERQGRPTIVVYRYRHELERLQKVFPGAPTTNKNKDMVGLLEAWNAGRIPVLLAQIQNLSHGLNMQETEGHIVFFHLTPSNEQHYQLVRRIYRMGQKHHVVVHYPVAAGTWDERAMQILEGKTKQERDLLTVLRNYWETIDADTEKRVAGKAPRGAKSVARSAAPRGEKAQRKVA